MAAPRTSLTSPADPWAGLTITIQDTRSEGSGRNTYTLYKVVLLDGQGREPYKKWLRFSEMLESLNDLKASFPNLPALPSKHSTFGRMHERTIITRCKVCSDFLSAALGRKECRQTKAFRDLVEYTPPNPSTLVEEPLRADLTKSIEPEMAEASMYGGSRDSEGSQASDESYQHAVTDSPVMQPPQPPAEDPIAAASEAPAPEAVWSTAQTHQLGQEISFDSKRKLLIAFDRVSTAVEALTRGDSDSIPDDVYREGYCIVFSKQKNMYYVIFRSDSQKVAEQKFNFEAAEQPAPKPAPWTKPTQGQTATSSSAVPLPVASPIVVSSSSSGDSQDIVARIVDCLKTSRPAQVGAVVAIYLLRKVLSRMTIRKALAATLGAMLGGFALAQRSGSPALADASPPTLASSCGEQQQQTAATDSPARPLPTNEVEVVAEERRERHDSNISEKMTNFVSCEHVPEPTSIDESKIASAVERVELACKSAGFEHSESRRVEEPVAQSMQVEWKKSDADPDNEIVYRATVTLVGSCEDLAKALVAGGADVEAAKRIDPMIISSRVISTVSSSTSVVHRLAMVPGLLEAREFLFALVTKHSDDGSILIVCASLDRAAEEKNMGAAQSVRAEVRSSVRLSPAEGGHVTVEVTRCEKAGGFYVPGPEILKVVGLNMCQEFQLMQSALREQIAEPLRIDTACVRAAQQLLSHFSAETSTSDGFKFASKMLIKPVGAEVSLEHKSGALEGRVGAFRAEAELDGTVQGFRDLMREMDGAAARGDFTLTEKLTPGCLKNDCLHQIGASVQILHRVDKLPWPMSKRDYVSFSASGFGADGTYFVCRRGMPYVDSIPSHPCAEGRNVKDAVRGILHLGGWRVTPCAPSPTGQPRIRVLQYADVDPGGAQAPEGMMKKMMLDPICGGIGRVQALLRA